MFSTLVKSVIFVSSLASLVSAHGFVHDVTLDGKKYKGDDPFTEGGSQTPKKNNPIRSIRNNGPAVPAGGKMANSPALACGRDQIKSIFTADVTAGSQVTLNWADWPHDSGPIITYLGACQNGDCSTTDPTKVDFFKIHEVGFEPGTTNWIQKTVLKAKKPFTFTLPKNVPSGKFIMRHEIIALHLADQKDGAEFYPSCIQVNVKGGTGAIPSQTVKFPGGYKNTDAGILFSIFNGNANLKKYKIPGPPIALGGVSTNSTTGDNTSEDGTTGNNTTVGDTTGSGTTGDNTTDGGTTDNDTTENDTTGDDTTGGDGCTGDNSDTTDQADATEALPTSTSKASEATTTGKAHSHSHGGKGLHHRGHKHSRDDDSDAFPLRSSRMIKRSRIHLPLDLAKATSS